MSQRRMLLSPWPASPVNSDEPLWTSAMRLPMHHRGTAFERMNIIFQFLEIGIREGRVHAGRQAVHLVEKKLRDLGEQRGIVQLSRHVIWLGHRCFVGSAFQ